MGDTDHRGDGANEMGDSLQTVDLGTHFTLRLVATGAIHVVAISTNGTAKAWGNGKWGQMGSGSTDDIGDQCSINWS